MLAEKLAGDIDKIEDEKVLKRRLELTEKAIGNIIDNGYEKRLQEVLQKDPRFGELSELKRQVEAVWHEKDPATDLTTESGLWCSDSELNDRNEKLIEDLERKIVEESGDESFMKVFRQLEALTTYHTILTQTGRPFVLA